MNQTLERSENIDSRQSQTPGAGAVPAYRRAPGKKREAILAAAKTRFIANGYDRTSTLEIARSAGVSEGILFHHFGSKKGLLACLAEEYAQAAAMATMPDNPIDLTEESIVRAAFDFADEQPMLIELLLVCSQDLEKFGIAPQSDVLVDAICSKLTVGMSEGKVRQGNPRIMAELQFALVDAAYKSWRRSADATLRESYINEAVFCMKAALHSPQ